MAVANGMDRGAAQLRLSRRLAGLLLAGTVLASVPAFAQEQTPADPTALTDPLALPSTDGGDATPDTATTTNSVPALTDEQQDALANAADDGAVGRVGSETERLNAPESSVDGARSAFGDPYEPTGIRLGSFVLRPSVSQGIGYEKTKVGSAATSRTFSTTGFRGSLTSDWSRHQWTIDAEGVYQRNISGVGETEPELRINSDLRLDLSGDTVANLTAGYSFERESTTDPNAINGARSTVHGFTGGARVTRDFGLIRGTIGVDLQREVYGSATASDGTRFVMSDRNYTEGTLTGRIGYELSPALIPYLEASVGKSIYDDKRDQQGFARSSSTLGGRAGMEIDLGEKLRGDLGIGFKRATFEDRDLAAIEAVTIDGSVFWSPRRGTDLRLGLRSEIEPSTTANESGYVTYETNAELTHELRDNLVARLSGIYTWRDFSSSATEDQYVYQIGTGLTWNLNRWLAMTGDVSYELTKQSGASDTGITRAGIGLVLRR
jgi:hypothetical protein